MDTNQNELYTCILYVELVEEKNKGSWEGILSKLGRN